MTTADAQHARAQAIARGWGAFRRWRRARPFWGGLLTVLAGVEIFSTTQMSLGGLTFQMGPTGFLSWLIPTILITCGLLLWFTPQHRMFYAVVAAMTAVFSLIAVNLGGFFIGMLLGMLGGALGFAWTPLPAAPAPVEPVPDADLPAGYGRSDPDGEDPDRTGYDTGASGPAGHRTDPDSGLDLLTDTLPQPRNPLREPAGGADAGPLRAVPAGWPAGEAGSAGPERPWGDRDDRIRPAADRPPPGSDQPRRPGSGLLAVLLLATGLTVTGTAVLDRAEPAWAAPCPSSTRPVPVPTKSAPPASSTPTATPSVTPDGGTDGGSDGGSDGNLITDIVDGIVDLFDGGADEPSTTPTPETTPTAGAPTATPTAPAPAVGETSAGPRTTRPAPPTGNCAPTSPRPSKPAEGAVPKLAADPDTPVAANVPSRLTGSALTMTGLRYEGIVPDFRTQAGTMPVLKFSMSRAVTTDFVLQIQGQPGRSLRYDSRRLTVDGDVEFYTTRFVGWILGIKLTLTPDSPLPPDGIDLSLPIPITFTDPDIQLALIECDTLSVDPSLTQKLA